MLRTLFTIGLMAVVGLFVLKLAFGLFGVALGLFAMVAVLAVKLLIVGALVYFVILVVSPSTARELREKFGK
jgi:antibiotic biosynthesis monooxygenase (ABM) superfamily enzyme